MSLVEYSDSEPDHDTTSPSQSSGIKTVSAKKTCTEGRFANYSVSDNQSALPPLPPGFRDLYSVSTRVGVQDDPTLHEGRKRAIPHVVGNWPTHLYLEWYPAKSELAALGDVISRCGSTLQSSTTEVHTLLYSDLGAQLPLHISLSRPVVLKTEERQAFTKQFDDLIRASGIRSFDLTLDHLDWVSNLDKTRWFLVLRVKKPTSDTLNRLLKTSNHALSLFGQPPLYYNPAPAEGADKKRKRRAVDDVPQDQRDYSECFHISIAWSLSEPSHDDKSRLKNVPLGKLLDIAIHFDSIKVKIGNQILSVELPAKVMGQSGLSGV